MSARLAHRGLEAAVVPQGDLRSQHGGDRLGGSEAAIDAGQYGVEPLQ